MAVFHVMGVLMTNDGTRETYASQGYVYQPLPPSTKKI